MEYGMRKRKRRLSREKKMSIAVTGALVCALAVGGFSIVGDALNSGTTGSGGGGTVIDLNEGASQGGGNFAYNEPETAVQPQTVKQEAAVQKAKEEVTKEETDNGSQGEAAQEKPVDAADNVSARYSFSENDTLTWPVAGDVILKYNVDSTIYFKTLGMYKTNPAINIASQVDEPVVAAASGVVTEVVTNEETGITLTVDIGNGYVTTYGLLKDVTLKKGMTIVAGEVIGKVAEPTKYYTEEGANVFFKLEKDGESLDPVMYLGE
jgi:murein DD-endopeptidase MepM/ murein hydrolase activator NlpD